jgi:2-dehydro-3-deoxyphosphogalactonate aldolase
MTVFDEFKAALAACPLVAILRGVRADESMDIGRSIANAGWKLIEVPLNSPDPLRSIGAIATALPHALVGAGTVLTAEQVRQVHAAGGRLIVAPNFNPAVVSEAVRLGMVCMPGVQTASEAFAALDAGADALKLFPAETIPPAAVKALRSVLPAHTVLLPVGGITTSNLRGYMAAGANGFGIGSALYQPGLTAAEVKRRATEFFAAWAGTMTA